MKMFHKENRNTWILCLLMFLVAIVAYPGLPDQVPIRFDASGIVDETGPRFSVFLMPGIALLLLLFAEISPRIDPRGNNYRRFHRQYYLIHFLLTLLLLFTELYTIAVCYRPELLSSFNMGLWMPALVGAMMAFCGNIMPKFKPNYFTGVKTPWTLADENVWYLTHRFTGKLWVACGILMIFAAFLPPFWKLCLFFPLILIMVLLPVLYSYLVYRRDGRSSRDGKDPDPKE
jgi:uncharacterized membrane protein